MDSIFLVIKRHALLAIFIFVFSLGAIASIHTMSPSIYEVKSSVYIQRQIPNQYQSQEYDDMMDHIRILKSDLVLDKIITKLKKDFPRREDIGHELLLKRLRADSSISSELGQVTKVVDLYFQDKSPRFAKRVLDYTLESYEEALEYIAQETRLKGLDFLKKRLAEVHRNHQQLAENLQKLETASGTTDIDLKNSELIKLKSNFAQLLGTTSAEISATEKQITHLHKILGLSPWQIKRLAAIKSDPKLDSWQKQLAFEKGELAKLKSTYTDDYPSVLEKEDTVQRLESLIHQRMQSSYAQKIQPASLILDDKAFSDMDAVFGKQLIELTTQRAALAQQKAYYEDYLTQLNKGFETIAFEKKDMADLRFALDILQTEEEKLQEKIQETVMEQANLLNMGSFVVLTPPLEPDKDDNIFPISLKTMLLLGSVASVVLSLFSIAIAEFLDPRVILFERPGVTLGEFFKEKARTAEVLYEELYQLCQGLALLVRKHNLQTVVFMELFDTLDRKYGLPIYSEHDKKSIESFWSPTGTIRALAGLYAFKCVDLKILYVSEMSSKSKETGLFNPFRKKLLIRDQGETQLYRSATQENLYLLTSESRQQGTLDPYVIERLQQEEGFDLTLIQQSSVSSKNSNIALQTRATLIQSIANGIVLGLSRSGSNVRQLHCLQKVATSEQIVGSIVFP
jgi:uncharacterized protein involved in exopolysaccharide biosynthesis